MSPITRHLASLTVALLLLPVTAVAAHAAPPPNDTVAGATVITVLPTTITQDTTEATSDAVDASLLNTNSPDCGGLPPAMNGTVWFAYTATDTDGFAVTNAGSTFSGGFLVTAGAPSGDTVVGCGQGLVVVPTTVVGTTYHVVAFSDQVEVNGGTLRATFLEIPADPTVSVDIDRHALRLRDGGVEVSGTYRCTGGEVFQIGGVVQQQRAGQTGSASFFTLPGSSDLVCDGEDHVWRVVGTVNEGRLRNGPATVFVSASVCSAVDCVTVRSEERVVLRPAGRR